MSLPLDQAVALRRPAGHEKTAASRYCDLMPEQPKPADGSVRWWEYYFVRYAMGTIVGGIVCYVLCSSTPILSPLVTHLEYLAAFGLVYCYIASAPILVFHAGRFRLNGRNTQVVDGAVFLPSGLELLEPLFGAWHHTQSSFPTSRIRCIWLPSSVAFSSSLFSSSSYVACCARPTKCGHFTRVSAGVGRSQTRAESSNLIAT